MSTGFVFIKVDYLRFSLILFLPVLTVIDRQKRGAVVLLNNQGYVILPATSVLNRDAISTAGVGGKQGIRIACNL